MTTLETRRFVVISTAHVSETTAKRLDNTPPKDWPCLGGHTANMAGFSTPMTRTPASGPTPFPTNSSTS